jgi:hypothetical protein
MLVLWMGFVITLIYTGLRDSFRICVTRWEMKANGQWSVVVLFVSLLIPLIPLS